MHVTTTSGYSGIYQFFPTTTLSSGSIWLHIVNGTVYVRVIYNHDARQVASTGFNTASQGTIPLQLKGDTFNEMVIYGNDAPADFYVDAITLTP
jgi:hypothetical protein